jgi:hypothetical protein
MAVDPEPAGHLRARARLLSLQQLQDLQVLSSSAIVHRLDEVVHCSGVSRPDGMVCFLANSSSRHLILVQLIGSPYYV